MYFTIPLITKVFKVKESDRKCQLLINTSMSIALAIVTVVMYILAKNIANMQYLFSNIEIYALLAIVPIMFYSGKKGYDNKIVQYGFYAYYPIHLIII